MLLELQSQIAFIFVYEADFPSCEAACGQSPALVHSCLRFRGRDCCHPVPTASASTWRAFSLQRLFSEADFHVDQNCEGRCRINRFPSNVIAPEAVHLLCHAATTHPSLPRKMKADSILHGEDCFGLGWHRARSPSVCISAF
ncbi:unnamed protein product [Symbiodinium sp. CCMP2456]|nr:unnamed protein product [Symbiodinium sp. CCMP2456]